MISTPSRTQRWGSRSTTCSRSAVKIIITLNGQHHTDCPSSHNTYKYVCTIMSLVHVTCTCACVGCTLPQAHTCTPVHLYLFMYIIQVNMNFSCQTFEPIILYNNVTSENLNWSFTTTAHVHINDTHTVQCMYTCTLYILYMHTMLEKCYVTWSF